jgi:peptidoglycan-N-acetylglucosamine deacetylase
MAAVLQRRRFMVSGPRWADSTCLTFDDGPHPEYTPRILDVLARCGVKATFFMVGKNMERAPGLVRRVADEGHELGGHSFEHAAPHETSARKLADEVERTQRLFEQIIGRRTDVFRPPHGKVTAPKVIALWRARQSVVLWNVDPRDYACGSPQELSARLAGAALRGGDVILLHDSVPHVADALPGFIETARARGLGFVTAGEWARLPRSGWAGARTRASVEFGCRFLTAGGLIQLTECLCL